MTGNANTVCSDIYRCHYLRGREGETEIQRDFDHVTSPGFPQRHLSRLHSPCFPGPQFSSLDLGERAEARASLPPWLLYPGCTMRLCQHARPLSVCSHGTPACVISAGSSGGRWRGLSGPPPPETCVGHGPFRPGAEAQRPGKKAEQRAFFTRQLKSRRLAKALCRLEEQGQPQTLPGWLSCPGFGVHMASDAF